MDDGFLEDCVNAPEEHYYERLFSTRDMKMMPLIEVEEVCIEIHHKYLFSYLIISRSLFYCKQPIGNWITQSTKLKFP